MSGDTGSVLLQYGAIGAMLIVLGLFARTLIAREQHRSDRLDVEVTRLNNLIADKVIPALVTATSVINDSQQLLQTMQHQRDVEQRARKEDGASLSSAAQDLSRVAEDVRNALARGASRGDRGDPHRPTV